MDCITCIGSDEFEVSVKFAFAMDRIDFQRIDGWETLALK